MMDVAQHPSGTVLLHKTPVPESQPHSLRWGTRSSVWEGAATRQRWKARKKPKLQLDGLALQTRALGDFWNSLGHRQCHVIVDRVIHTGQARLRHWKFTFYNF